MNFIKNILVTVMFAFLAIGMQAQSISERKAEKKLQRALKKEARAVALDENKERILELVQNQTFVIEATTIYDRRQNRYEVSPTINFVKISGEQGVVQFGFDHRVGHNGLGGLTIDGNISGYKVISTKAKDPVTITTNLTSTGLTGATTLTMRILNDGTAQATIIGSFGSRLTFAGRFYDLEDSTVYEGTSIL